jgi:hypothetical protein
MSDTSMSDEDDWLLPVLLVSSLCGQQERQKRSNRMYTGQDYVDDVLNCGNSIRIRSQLRMELETFKLLRD